MESVSRQQKIKALNKAGWFPYYSQDLWFPKGVVPSGASFGYSVNEAYAKLQESQK